MLDSQKRIITVKVENANKIDQNTSFYYFESFFYKMRVSSYIIYVEILSFIVIPRESPQPANAASLVFIDR